MKLFCLHCAGGSSSLFKGWKFKDIETIAIDLPGRGNNMNLPMLENFDETLFFVKDIIETQLVNDEPWILFGHSMGGYIAYEVERAIDKKPSLLILSGMNFPDEPICLSIMDDSDEDFMAKLSLLGGIPSNIKDIQLFADWFAPLIKNDLHILETYVFRHNNEIVDTSTVLINSVNDPLISKNVSKWKYFTNNFYNINIEGGHFSVYKEKKLIFSTIQKNRITKI
ncbi:alpha/beta hydrolase family protein [Clostridioides difficile CD45]|uniref:thioesterase II family protein n=2 Tax=Clostridioides difficile TaxID=1496 RepID=UPI00038D0C30|nr:alpha/beta fold hydrolase [Clostridioides difficile]EGT4016456.1 thioesterase [Clostridioides difficile]EGT4625353.1 thioesterase [Clostridioides difficile]EJA6846929.1 thioesterase [Clostridioides difficile]ELX4576144.1 thioesterase [Clostridioides difficile]EQE60334.1 alpha/beta hydrolase family protein [Clostridioides difficile CD45]